MADVKKLAKRLATSDGRYEAVRLHLDDVEEIIDRFRQAELSVVISDGTYEYDTIEELRESRGTHLGHFSVQRLKSIAGGAGGIASIFVGFHGPRADLMCLHPENLGELPAEIGALLSRRSVGYSTSGTFFLILTVTYLAGVVIFRSSPEVRTALLGAAVGAFLVFLVITLRRSRSGALLQRKHEGGFWKRNRDAVILLCIGALMGAVLTYLVNLLPPGSPTPSAK
ncbi:MAG: hypothetical protein H0T58_13830 [Gemmatimonadales bacterium]|nr:hypothetical protein [Gemmatimonadales bacterium]